ncbi:hypothetical protein MSAN_00768700 [Mycena sanguinolenta]|uniref:F-box domain-containing protein n=1 Tax=Mycena sanguinolenta TaxID=230812 RepID=A0A8H6Z6N9_9AGAR|nr:hypothetical protein MSAN_00768700 [Mycena sanguinolenta]
MTHPMKISELLQEIASFIENSQTLSFLTQVDRFSHAAVTPSLFRTIHIRLDRLDSLALALRNKPERAASCRSLTLSGTPKKGGTTLESVRQTLHLDLITLFRAISVHGVLTSLRWRSPRGVKLSEEVWAAISSALGSLHELDMYIPSADEQFWGALTSTRFTRLRILRLDLMCAHEWDCGHLQSLLDNLGHLEELCLLFPLCCDPIGLTLGSTYPHLKQFSFTSSQFAPQPDFLTRHPGLESLSLATEHQFCWGTYASSPTMLRALNVDTYSLCCSPTFVDFQIIHLRLRQIDEFMDDFVVDAVRALSQTLRYLELDILDVLIPDYVIPLLQTTHSLDELAINHHRWPSLMPPTLASDLLTATITIVDSSPLRALRFYCPQALPQERLLDLGRLPPQLKYIGWDLNTPLEILDFPPDMEPDAELPSSLVYVIEKRDDKNVVAKTLTKSSTDDWTTGGILHFMGESWTP